MTDRTNRDDRPDRFNDDDDFFHRDRRVKPKQRPYDNNNEDNQGYIPSQPLNDRWSNVLNNTKRPYLDDARLSNDDNEEYDEEDVEDVEDDRYIKETYHHRLQEQEARYAEEDEEDEEEIDDEDDIDDTDESEDSEDVDDEPDDSEDADDTDETDATNYDTPIRKQILPSNPYDSSSYRQTNQQTTTSTTSTSSSTNVKGILKAKYNVQYDYSQLASEIREKDAKASGNKYQYYKFRNHDGTYVYFPQYNVNILHHPKINKVIYNVSLYEFSNKPSYVLVYTFDERHLNEAPKVQKYSVSDFYQRYKNYILFDK